jgi:cysteine desulfurase family protein (TIGR01976 family)
MNETVRSQFPALSRTYNGSPLVYLDGPAGTQVPKMVIDAMADYYRGSNANTHGHFPTSRETDDIVDWTREQCAALTNAEDPACVSVGANMTSLAFKLSRAFSRLFQPGDEVLITQLDHEANRGPWIRLRDHGIVVKEIDLLPNGQLNYDDAQLKITSKTKLVCAGWSSNILGTVNDLQKLRKMSAGVGAWLLVDAVHHAAHFSMDVQQLDCDFLLCSAYKFYGPHIGILYTRKGLLDMLDTDRLRTAGQKAPERIETGTLNHAALAGVGACIDFIASTGDGRSTREKLVSAYALIHKHEHALASELWEGLNSIPGITTYGPDFSNEMRAPTMSFTIDGKSPADLCKFLGDRGICAWDGHFYAIRTTEVLGLLEKGGVTRMGIVAYNTHDEVDRTLNAIHDFVTSHP